MRRPLNDALGGGSRVGPCMDETADSDPLRSFKALSEADILAKSYSPVQERSGVNTHWSIANN